MRRTRRAISRPTRRVSAEAFAVWRMREIVLSIDGCRVNACMSAADEEVAFLEGVGENEQPAERGGIHGTWLMADG
jgi:hypothetical protein